MRILLLNYEYPPLGGGAANATYCLLQEFSKMSELQVDLVTSSASEYRVERPGPNLTLHFLDIGKQGSLHYQSMRDLINFAWKSHFYAQRLIAKRNIQLIHAFFGVPSGFTALQLNLPYIVSLRGSDVPFYNKRFELLDLVLFKSLSRRIWKKAAKVVANSQGLKDLAHATAPQQQIDVIVNGVDTDVFRPKKNKRKSTGPIRLVSTGRLIQRKGYEYLLDALKGRSDFNLVLVGDGDRRHFLENKARANGVRVQFTGRLERAEVVSELQQADLFVLPSLNEGMSNSVLEALACGLPVITTPVGGSDELVNNGQNGFVVQKESVDSLAAALTNYATSRKLIDAHGVASRRIALTMSWGQVSRAYARLYERVVDSKA